MPDFNLKTTVILLIILVVFSLSIFKISSYDFWWHLASGKYIVKNNTIPYQDPFSFGSDEDIWVDGEWIFQIIIYSIYLITGIKGLIVFKASVIALAFLFIILFLDQQDVSLYYIIGITAISLLLAKNRFYVRPEIFTYLFLSLMLFILWKSKSKKLILWIIPFIFVLWVNIHPGYIAGLLILGLFASGESIEFFLSKSLIRDDIKTFEKDTLYHIWGITLASGLACFLNPYGYRVFVLPFKLTSLLEELLTTGFLKNQEWIQPSIFNAPILFIAFIYLIVIIFTCYKKSRFSVLLILGFTGYISLRYIRNEGLFGIILPFLIFIYLSGSDSERKNKIKSFFTLAVVTGVILISIVSGTGFKLGLGVDSAKIPKKAVEFINSKDFKGHMFNEPSYGGYISWKLYPEHQIFMDGRNEIHIGLLKRITDCVNDSAKWNNLLDDHNIQFVIFGYVEKMEKVYILPEKKGDRTKITTKPSLLNKFPRKDWALVYWDDLCLIYARRGGINQDIIDKYEYKHVYPEYLKYNVRMLNREKLNFKELRSDLKRRMKEKPFCSRALRFYRSIREK